MRCAVMTAQHTHSYATARTAQVEVCRASTRLLTAQTVSGFAIADVLHCIPADETRPDSCARQWMRSAARRCAAKKQRALSTGDENAMVPDPKLLFGLLSTASDIVPTH